MSACLGWPEANDTWRWQRHGILVGTVEKVSWISSQPRLRGDLPVLWALLLSGASVPGSKLGGWTLPTPGPSSFNVTIPWPGAAFILKHPKQGNRPKTNEAAKNTGFREDSEVVTVAPCLLASPLGRGDHLQLASKPQTMGPPSVTLCEAVTADQPRRRSLPRPETVQGHGRVEGQPPGTAVTLPGDQQENGPQPCTPGEESCPQW